ncbi:hypothetical protein TW95_gp0737 [Pandoravirus inopinatum]|uniref:Uncharacterized protein n=1 Tax=Pandoravirus inopinatum TaxID=1605721 RepID=A0A0B5J9C5_9VIRU|nr:hypothetical protein TW95_gp0737 [Pandoravirus inopinatum]AJF97471.1 hypothetical protein [Pandoravirus inopinatum]
MMIARHLLHACRSPSPAHIQKGLARCCGADEDHVEDLIGQPSDAVSTDRPVVVSFFLHGFCVAKVFLCCAHSEAPRQRRRGQTGTILFFRTNKLSSLFSSFFCVQWIGQPRSADALLRAHNSGRQPKPWLGTTGHIHRETGCPPLSRQAQIKTTNGKIYVFTSVRLLLLLFGSSNLFFERRTNLSDRGCALLWRRALA